MARSPFSPLRWFGELLCTPPFVNPQDTGDIRSRQVLEPWNQQPNGMGQTLQQDLADICLVLTIKEKPGTKSAIASWDSLARFAWAPHWLGLERLSKDQAHDKEEALLGPPPPLFTRRCHPLQGSWTVEVTLCHLV